MIVIAVAVIVVAVIVAVIVVVIVHLKFSAQTSMIIQTSTNLNHVAKKKIAGAVGVDNTSPSVAYSNRKEIFSQFTNYLFFYNNIIIFANMQSFYLLTIIL